MVKEIYEDLSKEDLSEYDNELERMPKSERISEINYFISEATRCRYGYGRVKRVTSIILSQELEVSQSTIKIDIKYMREQLGAPIVYDRYDMTYYYSEKDFKLPESFNRKKAI